MNSVFEKKIVCSCLKEIPVLSTRTPLSDKKYWCRILCLDLEDPVK